MKNKMFYLVLLCFFNYNCSSQSIDSNIFDVRKDIAKASLRKYAFCQCLNASLNDSLEIKINDSSIDNLYNRVMYIGEFARLNNDSLISLDSYIKPFTQKWGANQYPNLDHPGSKMHVTNCLNMYESYELDLFLEGVFKIFMNKNEILDPDLSDLSDNTDPANSYKYYRLYQDQQKKNKK